MLRGADSSVSNRQGGKTAAAGDDGRRLSGPWRQRARHLRRASSSPARPTPKTCLKTQLLCPQIAEGELVSVLLSVTE